MPINAFKKVLIRARRELEEQEHKRDLAEARIAQLKRIIASVASFVEPQGKAILGIEQSGLKNSVRTALRAIGKDATATDVRAVLRELRFPIETHANPIGSIHTVLTRLVADGEVAYGSARGGRKTYAWILPSYGASNSFANQRADRERAKR